MAAPGSNGSHETKSSVIQKFLAQLPRLINSIKHERSCKILYTNIPITYGRIIIFGWVRNHANTITSEIAAKQTVITEVYIFFNKILQRYKIADRSFVKVVFYTKMQNLQNCHSADILYIDRILFDCVGALRPSQQCFSHVGMFLGLEQYLAEEKSVLL